LKTKLNFSLTEKCFSLTNFSIYKQTQESLENGLQKTIFHKTNRALVFLYRFDVSVLKKYYFNIFLNKIYLKKQPLNQ
jgi:hypothetical protein